MVLNDRPLKRARKVVSSDLYDFLSFPAAGDGDCGDGSFRSKVRIFLNRHARASFTPSLFPSLVLWQILFRIGDPAGGAADSAPDLVVFDVVEEDVTRSRSVYCDQCRVVGWSNHPVCAKRYHFIIRAETDPCEGYQKPCSRCGNLLHLLDSRCKSCGCEIGMDDLEDWVYLQLEDTSHLLHGVVHSNGYGHLLRVNGREGGSKHLSGCDIMNFWDRLCKAIAVRKVSVMDVSKKYGMEYRLLHAIIRGHPWYGDWGYDFGSGSYALTREAYRKAVDALSGLPLSSFLFQGRGPRSQLQAIILFYQSMSESQLVNLKDLFSFLLRLIHETHKPSVAKARSRGPVGSSTSNVLCCWTRDDVERVQRAMIKILLAAAGNSGWVSGRSLKGALCKSASLELLDYCLKYLGGRLAVGGMVVQTRCNPTSSRAVEFRLEPLNCIRNETGLNANGPSEEHIIRDLKFLFDSLVNPQTMVRYRPQATRRLVVDSAAKLLDCKQFLKDYQPERTMMENPNTIQLWCYMELVDDPKDDVMPPPELIALPYNATVGDLKLEASRAFQEAYPTFKRFQAEEFLEYGPVDDSMTLKLLIGPSRTARVRGRCPGSQALSIFRMERGTESWIVDCMCGAKDDDGERMLACDTCGVWLHTRCAGINSFEAVPAKFVCIRCSNSRIKEPDASAKKKPDADDAAAAAATEEASKVSTTTCRTEAITNSNISGSGLAMSLGIR